LMLYCISKLKVIERRRSIEELHVVRWWWCWWWWPG